MTPPLEALAANPFYVLELSPEATPLEVERQGQKLLAMLGVGLHAAGQYPTPFGPRPRTEDAVRQALAALRDPTKRADAEAWLDVPSPGPAPRQAPRWTDLRERLGWR
jgi:hypothetical protein